MAGRKVVSVALEAKVQGFISGMRSAKASVDDLTAAAAPNKQTAFDDLSNKAALAGGAIAVGLGVAVKKFAEFDSAMSAVQANSGSTGAELESLRKAALDLGADTQFSATEAADGINELAKAGVGASDILGGGLKGSLDLAAAGQIGVGEAAETAATAMTQFNLEGGEIPHVADLLTNAANKAQGGVGDLAQALKQGGLVAASTGLTIDETTASLAAFASAGLIGSDAGTSLKTMLQRLSAPSGEAAALMEKLGISAYDASGEFVGMEALAGQLQSGLSGLTAEQRNSALATIFGSDAVRAANILYSEGAQGISKWTDEVTEQGAAAKQAATLTDNLQGDVERLGGALDSAFIKTGSGANSALRTLVQGLTGVVDHVGKIPGPVLLAGGALTSLALVAPKAISSFRETKATFDGVGLSMDNLSKKAPKTAAAVQGLGRALGGLVVAGAIVGQFSDGIEQIGSEKLTGRLLDSADAVEALNNAWSKGSGLDGRVDSQIRSLGDALRVSLDPSFVNQVNNGIGSFFGIFTGDNMSDIAVAKSRLSELDGVLAGLVTSGNADEAARQFAAYEREAKAAGFTTEQLESLFPGYTEAVAAAGNQSKLAGDDMAGMGTDAQTAEDAVSDLSDAIRGLGDALLQQEASQDGYEASLDAVNEALKENGRTLDASTEKGRANRAALRDLANSTQEWAAAELEAGASTTKVQGILDRGRAKWVAHRDALGQNRAETRRLADELFSIDGLEPKANVDVNTKAAKKKADDFKAAITGMDGQSASVSVKEEGASESKTRVSGLIDEINGLFGKDVKVTESGASPSKARVLAFNTSIRDLSGKTVTVSEAGATAATARAAGLRQGIASINGKTVTVTEVGTTEAGNRVVMFKNKIYEVPPSRTSNIHANVHGLWDVQGLVGAIAAVQDKSVTIQAAVIGAGLGARWAGGIDGIDPMAAGGMRPGGSVRPGLYGTSKRGILMAEDTRSKWEAYIPERPDLRGRAEAILEETARRFGKAVIPLEGITAMASGGVYSRWRSQLAAVNRLSNRYRWEDGSRQIQVFEDGTARWRGYGAAPAAVAQAIASLNAAQDAYEDALNAKSQPKATRYTGQHSQAYYDTLARWAANKGKSRYTGQHSDYYYKKQAEWAAIRKQRAAGGSSGGGAFMRSTPSPHEGRTYVAPAPRITSGGSSSASTYSGSITEAGMERAITSAFSRVKVVTTINGRDFAGVIQRTAADRKGR